MAPRFLTSAILCFLAAGLPCADDALAQPRLPENVEVARDVQYGTGGDATLLLDIYKPKEPIAKPTPAVVWIHGGGWRGGSKQGASVAVPLAAQGFFTVSIDYRLSGVAPFPAAVEDCKCAIRWLRAHAEEYGVDPERIGVAGGSAGAHLAMMVGCVPKQAGLEGAGGWEGVSSGVAAVCSYFGPTDFTRGHQEFESGRGTAPLLFLGGTMEEKPEAYKLASPLTHVSEDDPPLLMIHGEQDRTVPLDQSERMLAAYRKAGAQAELIVVKGAGHGFGPVGQQTPSLSRREITAKTIEFFKQHLLR